jgi:hypothetical protein
VPASGTGTAPASASLLLEEIEYLRRSGVEEGSAVLRGHMDAFLDRAAEHVAATTAATAGGARPRQGRARASQGTGTHDAPGSGVGDGVSEAGGAWAAKAATAQRERLRQRVLRGQPQAASGAPGAADGAGAHASPDGATDGADAGGGLPDFDDSDEEEAAADAGGAAGSAAHAQAPDFYDDAMDDDDQAWVDANLRRNAAAAGVAAASRSAARGGRPAAAGVAAPGGAGGGDVLSCPYCFTVVAYDAQQHAQHEHQFRALQAARGVRVVPDAELVASGRAAAAAAAPHAAAGAHLQPVQCGTCGTQVGVLERPAAGGGRAGSAQEVFHFFHVVPGTG